MGKKQKQKIILPPELPPEILEDEIEVSDEDLQFVSENRDYAGFVSRLDTHSITKFVASSLFACLQLKIRTRNVVVFFFFFFWLLNELNIHANLQKR